jgi:hypothetical protein
MTVPDRIALAVAIGLVRQPSHAPQPGLVDEAEVARVGDQLQRGLVSSHPDVEWSVCPVPEPLDVDPAPVSEVTSVLSQGRRALLGHDLDIVVVLTDQPLELHGRPVSAHVSPMQQIVVISAPAFGARRARIAQAAAELVCGMLDTETPDQSSQRVLHELAATITTDDGGAAYLSRAVRGSTRLLFGMIRANRPWLLTIRLTRTLVGAFAAAFVAIVTPDVWTLADSMHLARLVLLAVLVLVVTTAVLVIGGGLRERAPSRRVRRTVLIHNVAAWFSVGLGVLALYLGLVVGGFAVTLLVLPWSLVGHTVGHQVGIGTMLRVGGLASVVALVGSAFGASLEDDDDVQRAAYTTSDDTRYTDEPRPNP